MFDSVISGALMVNFGYCSVTHVSSVFLIKVSVESFYCIKYVFSNCYYLSFRVCYLADIYLTMTHFCLRTFNLLYLLYHLGSYFLYVLMSRRTALEMSLLNFLSLTKLVYSFSSFFN